MAAVRQVPLFADNTAEKERRILSEDAIARRRAMADALRAQSANAGQIESPWEGLAQMSNSVFAGLADRRADTEAERRSAEIARVLSGIDPNGGAISPETIQQALALDPELGMSLLGQQRTAAQAERERAANANKPMEVGGRLVRPDGTVVYEPPVPPPEPLIVRPGEIGVNPNTGEIIFNNPREPDAPIVTGPGDIGRDREGTIVFQNPVPSGAAPAMSCWPRHRQRRPRPSTSVGRSGSMTSKCRRLTLPPSKDSTRALRKPSRRSHRSP
jgi:hypothetical protein